MINKDNNLNIDILRQQNANIPSSGGISAK